MVPLLNLGVWLADLRWGDVPAGAAALTGTAAVLLALGQVRTERNARYERERSDAAHRKVAQAEKIAAWVSELNATDGPWTVIEISNASDQPVYWAIISFVAVQGAGPQSGLESPRENRAFASVIPPGRSFARMSMISMGMYMHPGLELAFTDYVGNHWVRKATGKLRQVEAWAVETYNLGLPVDWVIPSTKPSGG